MCFVRGYYLFMKPFLGSFLFRATNGSTVLEDRLSRSETYTNTSSSPCSELLESGSYAYDGTYVYVLYVIVVTWARLICLLRLYVCLKLEG